MAERLLFKEDLGDREIAPHLRWLVESKADLAGMNDTAESRLVLTEPELAFFEAIKGAGALREVAEIGLVMHEASDLGNIARQVPTVDGENPSESKVEYEMIRMGQRRRMDELLRNSGIKSEIDDLTFAERIGGYVAAVRRVAEWTDNGSK